MSWASLLKAGGKAAKWAGRGAGRILETGGKAILHPQQTLKGAGTALKTAAVGGGLGYVGWKKITTDESVVGIVSDAIIGEKAEKVSGAAENVDGKLNGISSFLSDVSSGNGGQMLGGFLQNLTHGNVSGMGVMGLVLSAFLVFGRFGWMAKLAGAMLAMMTIGNNSQRVLSPAVQPADAVRTSQAMNTGNVRQEEQPLEVEQIHRHR